MSESKLSRRVVLTVLVSLPVVSLVACGGGAPEAITCGGVSGEQQTARTTLQYVAIGPDPARHCSNCQLYTGTATACGSCQVLPGEISPQGSCLSFVQRA